jgi:hypothetical protein
MAKITFAAGTSHTPMLLASDETLPRFLETDSLMKHRDKEGRPVTYGDLLEKADPKLADMVAPQNLVARQNVAREAAKHLRQALAAARLDALIVMGDDQNESYLEDCRPAFAVYYGETIRNNVTQHTTYRHLPEWYIKNRQGFFEADKPRDYPVHSGLATAKGRVTRSPMCTGTWSRPRTRCRWCRSSSTPTTRRTSRGRGAATRSARRCGAPSRRSPPTSASACSPPGA